MADENRWRDDDRMRQQDDRFGQGWSGSQESYGQPQGFDRGYGQGSYGQGGDERGQTYGQSYGHAGGYDRSYGNDRGSGGWGGSGGMSGGQQGYGQQYGAGEPIPYDQRSHGFAQQNQQGFSRSTGYGGLQPMGGQGGQNTSYYGVERGGGGFAQGGSSGGAYTGQTGTGYGHTYGGQTDRGRDDQSWWEKAKDRAESLFTGDHGRQGMHRGRGPKGYSRSDERVRDDVNDRLTDDPFLDASDIEVMVDKGEVTLTGMVSSREDKRRAEDLADNVSGVKHVQNNLRVGRSDDGGLFSKDRQTGLG